MQHPRGRRVRTIAVAALTAALLAPTTAHAAIDRVVPESAATWTSTIVDREGGALAFDGETVDVGSTLDALIGLAAVGREDLSVATLASISARGFDAALADYLAPAATPVGGIAGRLGKYALLRDAVGAADPAAEDLDERIAATVRADATPEAGLFLEAEADFNAFGQTFQQSLAILGLVAYDRPVPASAVQWLLDQQCADGGFANRPADQRASDDDDSCDDQVAGADTPDDPGDDRFISPPDLDGSALAIQALAATAGDTPPAEVAAAIAAGLDFLASRQDPNGGFGASAFLAEGEELGDRTNANTTSLAIQAIVAGGEDPLSGRWVKDGTDPQARLAASQLDCTVPPADRGAFPFPFFGTPADAPNAFATYQGMWGLTGRPFPFTAPPTIDPSPQLFRDCGLQLARASGRDRYATSYAIARTALAGGADTAILATGRDFADAVVAGPLAAALDAALLLADGERPTQELLDVLGDLGVERLVVLGGEAAVAQSLVDSIVDLTDLTADDVERVRGPNRWATAAAVLERLEQALSETAGSAVVATEVYVTQGRSSVPGQGFADALGLTQLAGLTGTPILLTAPDALPGETATAVDGRTVQVVGGPSAVSDAVLAELDAANGAPAATREIRGSDRYDTTRRVAITAWLAGADPALTWVATGSTFPDALTAAAAAAVRGELFLLVPGSRTELGDTLSLTLTRFGALVDRVVVAGGTGAVSSSIADQVAAALDVGAL